MLSLESSFKEYGEPTRGSMGLPFSSSLEGGWLQQYLYS